MLKRLFLVILLMHFIFLFKGYAQQFLDVEKSTKAAKQALKFYKKEQFGEALNLMYHTYEKINSRKLKPGLKKKYIDAKKSLKKYKTTHVPIIQAIQRTEKALKDSAYLVALQLHFFKVDEKNMFPSTLSKYKVLFAQVEKIYKSVNDTLIQPAIKEYKEIYLSTGLNETDVFTGSVEDCDPGDVPWDTKLKLLKRANYFRKLAKVPEIKVLDSARSKRAQYSSLMMNANGMLSHHPDTTWKCYTKIGAGQAGSSSLSLTGTTSVITGLVMDRGDHNKRVGHRTNLLYPHGDICSIGLVPRNKYSWALTFDVWYSGGFNYRDAPLKNKLVNYAYPNNGVIPATLLSKRWSCTLMNLGKSIAKAKVEVYDEKGDQVKIVVEHNSYQNLVWYIDGLDKYDIKESRWYHVKVSNLPENKQNLTTIEYPVIVIGTNELK